MNTKRYRTAASLLAAAFWAACTETNSSLVAASLTISPDTARLRNGQSQQFTATVLNSAGAQLSGVAVTFTSNLPTVAITTAGGLVTAVATGTAIISAQSDGAGANAVVIVSNVTAAKVSLTPDSFDVAVGAVTPSTVLVLDASNNAIPGAPVVYTSSDTTVFVVSASGVLTPRSSGVALLRAVSGAARDSSPVVVFRNFPGTLQPRAVVASRPFGVQISSQNVMYVTQQDADSLTRFNLPSLTRVAAVAVGDDPGEVIFTANGARAYTTNVLGNNVSSVNVATGATTATFPIGQSAYRIRLSTNETQLYVSTNAGNVRVLDATSGNIVATVAAIIGPANGLALSSDGLRLYVSSMSGNIAEVSTATNAVLRTLTVPGKLQDIALSPDGTEIYAANEDGSVKVIRVSNGTLIVDIPLPGGPFGLRVSPNGQFIAVTLATDGKIVIFDRVLRRTVRTFNVGGQPRRIAFDATSATMAVANEQNGVDVVR